MAANVQGAAVERALGKQRMPLMHGCFSVGTVIGSIVGTAMTALGVSVAAHMTAVYAVVIVLVVVGMAFTRTESEDVRPATTGIMAIVDPEAVPGKFSVRYAWMEKRTVLLGVFVLGMALAEGSANDWVALALTHGYGASDSVGAVGYGLFVTAMTSGRLLGTGLLTPTGGCGSCASPACWPWWGWGPSCCPRGCGWEWARSSCGAWARPWASRWACPPRRTTR
ncbi:hypothetical protein A5N15_02670 [Rothia kristinae]|uniref:Major facilitator superfamily (MFS) profile domain-containing protein n=1 Tax=Rothia kristinae TaxID=37923 RepID=A0A657IVR1_9MICC|nr:hypothetical protein A5N15_02670 [Rothia kristinae]